MFHAFRLDHLDLGGTDESPMYGGYGSRRDSSIRLWRQFHRYRNGAERLIDTAEFAGRVNWARRLGLGSKELRAWAMYDWANSAFATTIVAAFLPLYYKRVAASQFTDAVASGYWAYTGAIALVIIAVLSPVLGAIADYMGVKKRFLAVFMGFGATFTALLYFVGEGDWLLASAIFIMARIGFSGANVFYEALLPSGVRPGVCGWRGSAGAQCCLDPVPPDLRIHRPRSGR
jgi:hypothetical protein